MYVLGAERIRCQVRLRSLECRYLTRRVFLPFIKVRLPSGLVSRPVALTTGHREGTGMLQGCEVHEEAP